MSMLDQLLHACQILSSLPENDQEEAYEDYLYEGVDLDSYGDSSDPKHTETQASQMDLNGRRD